MRRREPLSLRILNSAPDGAHYDDDEPAKNHGRSHQPARNQYPWVGHNRSNLGGLPRARHQLPGALKYMQLQAFDAEILLESCCW